MTQDTTGANPPQTPNRPQRMQEEEQEERKRMETVHASIRKALVANLNRNVRNKSLPPEDKDAKKP